MVSSLISTINRHLSSTLIHIHQTFIQPTNTPACLPNKPAPLGKMPFDLSISASYILCTLDFINPH